ncbi:MAG: peptide chain release factor N(5)-glutamine methyltransferase [Firmicutes bacterium]|nr:peptide chain release factor N(5)-glutamine methyltransferase [Bacillota bacterium]
MSAPAAPRPLMEYVRLATGYLKNCGSPSPRLDAELLLAHVLGTDRVSLYVNHDRPLVLEEVEAYRTVLRQRCRGMPVAYITGRRAFLSFDLRVGPQVLIPRPETELLVEAAVQELPANESLHLCDVGTGSGAVAIGLARALPRARVLAVDISPEALAVARENVAACGLENRIAVVEGDLLSPLLDRERATIAGGARTGLLDAVVSNPPYIPSGQWENLPREIKDYEPRIALDGGEDGLEVYRRLIPQASLALRPGGLLALEIGHDQETRVQELLAAGGAFGAVKVIKDYAGHPRVVLAVREA